MPRKYEIRIPSGLSAKLAKKWKPQLMKAAHAALPKIGMFFIDRVSQEANVHLRPATAAAYKAGLTAPGSVTVVGTTLSIRLVGNLPNDLEKGYDAFDIKEAMLRGGRVKYGKSGPYVDVAFRHGSHEGTVNFPGMPSDIKAKMAKAIAAGSNRLKMKTPGKEFTRDLLFGGKSLSMHVKHKRGIYDDMLRIQQMVKKKTSNKYITIRRISERSGPTSWWHPGFRGIHAFRKSLPQLRSTSIRIFRHEMQLAGVKVK